MPLRSPMPNRGSRPCTRVGLSDCRTVGPMLLVLGALLSGSPTVGLSDAVAQQRSAYEELQTFSGVLNHVRLNYVDSVTYAQMVRAAIVGVLHALDPHSLFFSRDDWERRNALERGELAVTGLSFENVDSAITVLSVSPRSPAARAGVLPGDRLTTVNDTAIAGLDVEKIALRMAGEKGSKVRLQFERGPRLEPDTFTITLKRDFLHPLSVSIVRMADSATGYVRLDEFGPTAAEEVHRGLKDLKGKGMRRLILDLRANPGGYVIAAVELASEFLPKGTVVFRTDNGRPVRGGGGVTPDVALAPPAPLPVWWSVASDSGFDFAIADSVALTLAGTPPGRDAWMTSPEQWRGALVAPFLARVRARLHVAAPVDTALEARLARILALRAAEVRWGPEARDEFLVRASADVRSAIGYFPQLAGLLAAPTR